MVLLGETTIKSSLFERLLLSSERIFCALFVSFLPTLLFYLSLGRWLQLHHLIDGGTGIIGITTGTPHASNPGCMWLL